MCLKAFEVAPKMVNQILTLLFSLSVVVSSDSCSDVVVVRVRCYSWWYCMKCSCTMCLRFNSSLVGVKDVGDSG